MRFALEVHPTEIAFDFVTTAQGARRDRPPRPEFGFNFDPSHFVAPVPRPGRVRRASSPTASTTCTSRTRSGGSTAGAVDPRLAPRTSATRAAAGTSSRPGRGDVDFEAIIRALNRIGYDGPALGRVGGLRHGPRVGRAGRARVRAPDRLRAVGRRVRRGVRGDGHERPKANVGEPTRPASGDGCAAIGVGMLGYAFMGKAHSNAYSTLAYMTWPPPLRRGSSRSPGATRRRSPRPRAATASSAVTDWRELVADPESSSSTTAAPTTSTPSRRSPPPRPASTSSARSRSARTADESYEIWQRVAATGVKHMCAFNYRFVPAVRLARELIEAGELGEIHHFRGELPAGVGARPDLADVALRRSRRRLGRARRPRRAHHRPRRATWSARSTSVSGADAHVHRASAAGRHGRRRRRVRVDRRVRERRDRHARGDALRARAQERHPLGDQRLEGLARVRPRAAQRAPGPPPDETADRRRASATCSCPRPTIRSGSTGGPTATSSAGSTRSCTSCTTCSTRSATTRRRPARRDVRGRLPRRRDLRRDRALRGLGRTRDRCATADVSNERS